MLNSTGNHVCNTLPIIYAEYHPVISETPNVIN